MSTHNICIGGEIRKILCGYPLLSVAMITGSFEVKRCLSAYVNVQIILRICTGSSVSLLSTGT